MLDIWGASSPETLAFFLYGVIESWFSETYTKDIPSSLEHMPKETRNDVGFVCFLLEIHKTLEVGMVFCLVCCGSERNIDVFTSHPLIEIVFDLSKAKLDMIFNLPKKRLTTVWTKATVAIGSMLSSENSGWMAPSSSLFLNQILLIRVWIRGARKMPVFNIGSYAQHVSCGMIYACDRVPCK